MGVPFMSQGDPPRTFTTGPEMSGLESQAAMCSGSAGPAALRPLQSSTHLGQDLRSGSTCCAAWLARLGRRRPLPTLPTSWQSLVPQEPRPLTSACARRGQGYREQGTKLDRTLGHLRPAGQLPPVTLTALDVCTVRSTLDLSVQEQQT
jgi:hypothetical protein